MRARRLALVLLLLAIPRAAAADSLRTPAGVDTLVSTPPAVLPSSAASIPDTLRIYSHLFSISGYRYRYGDRKGDVGIGAGEVKAIVGDNPKALEKAKTFTKYQIPSFILASLSTLAVIGGIAGDNGTAAAIGLSGWVVSWVVDELGYSHLKKSARIFNAELFRRKELDEERTNGGTRRITVILKSGRTIESRKVGPHGLGIIKVERTEGDPEFHDASQIRSIRNGYGQDITEQVLDRGSTVTAP